ncbi:hypothetical protein [Paenibacillus spongiae]|uniref:Uncharacterized protein n=1 Tax=Paenibacillus spongiae TaxID=2909671 RepID=A0ABY5S6N3_9BACL|nr:hypothetical protein [Paenibacillus spongiae]UVI29324.1 hypothetical protein L1F29_28495 [Paenibacillus spongiae]
MHTQETEKIREFFQNSFFADSGSVFLVPTGWVLEEALQESLALRTFRAFAESLLLVVDAKDNRVVGLDLYG